MQRQFDQLPFQLFSERDKFEVLLAVIVDAVMTGGLQLNAAREQVEYLRRDGGLRRTVQRLALGRRDAPGGRPGDDRNGSKLSPNRLKVRTTKARLASSCFKASSPDLGSGACAWG